jgi:hypothetical protein
MKTRIKMMHELVDNGYAAHPSFYGWYFASEAYLQPYFQDSFIAYVNLLAREARELTEGCKIFISPYGTRFAVNDQKFVEQLQALDVDIIAYQDEVGCVRDRFPVKTSSEAFTILRAAHDQVFFLCLLLNFVSGPSYRTLG